VICNFSVKTGWICQEQIAKEHSQPESFACYPNGSGYSSARKIQRHPTPNILPSSWKQNQFIPQLIRSQRRTLLQAAAAGHPPLLYHKAIHSHRQVLSERLTLRTTHEKSVQQ